MIATYPADVSTGDYQARLGLVLRTARYIREGKVLAEGTFALVK